MRIVITGGTGFLGRPLVRHLAGSGYGCTVLTRDPQRAAKYGFPREVAWVAASGELPAADVIIHLAGESIVGRWTAGKKRAILASRVEGTQRLVAALRTATTRPHTLLAASAVGFYGDRPGEALDENALADPRKSFRSEVCRKWESAANEAEDLGIRVVNLRMGNVMDPTGGYLGGLLPLYRAFGGFIIGSEMASIPWISRRDCVHLIAFALANERWYGPLNVTHPEPLSHRVFARSLTRRLGRSCHGKLPARLLRLALGDFASALLDDQRVEPAKVLAAGFQFSHPTWISFLDDAFPAPACHESLMR